MGELANGPIEQLSNVITPGKVGLLQRCIRLDRRCCHTLPCEVNSRKGSNDQPNISDKL